MHQQNKKPILSSFQNLLLIAFSIHNVYCIRNYQKIKVCTDQRVSYYVLTIIGFSIIFHFQV